ncbi:2-aminoethylphosphonate:pyruvate aminotransferase [invertebrate metagenome]|uniref:2-aminoethylphosphonate--pyruvate transaminase n=1 Tax=invertebrate metagenome TaxID=1711999 RepID=A0A484HCV5_9ZZZZ
MIHAVSPTFEEPLLLTPGPLTTARATREAMLRDFGSRDSLFMTLNRSVRERLLNLSGAAATHTCVPLQGSGTFAVEAMLGTLVPRTGGLVLVLVNGAYGRRMVEILDRIDRPYIVYETAETVPPTPKDVELLLMSKPDITHVAMVHCETTTGIINPIKDIAQIVYRHGRLLLLDSISAFGALDVRTTPFTALAASSGKCLEGVPGLAFVLCDRTALQGAAGQAHTLSLDLEAQWTAMERDGQWRFTPPTQVLVALSTALDLFYAAGGQPARLARYTENCRVLIEGMRGLGFVPLLSEALQAPTIVTFHMPTNPAFRFEDFYARMRGHGYVLYTGKLALAASFRVGCIGAIEPSDIAGMVATAASVLRQMGVT